MSKTVKRKWENEKGAAQASFLFSFLENSCFVQSNKTRDNFCIICGGLPFQQAGWLGGLIRKITWKGNMRVGQILSKTGCGGGRFEKKY